MMIDSRVILKSKYRYGVGCEEAADMTDSFVGWSAGGGKRTTAALALKCTLMSDNGSVGIIPCVMWDKYIESAVHILSTHSMFGCTTNFTLPCRHRVLLPNQLYMFYP